MNYVLPTYYILWILFIGLRRKNGFSFLLHGLRTEFKRKATCSVEAAETTFHKVTQISQMTQILLSYVFLSRRFRRFTQIYFLVNSFLCHADFADDADFTIIRFLSRRFRRFTQIFHWITPLNLMKKNLRNLIDRPGLNLCESVKSVGHKKS